MSELGSLLRNKRESLGKSVKDISNETRIIEGYIRNIEDGEYDKLPSYLHSYGFVRKYAENLGFDYEKDIVELFQQECPKEGSVLVKQEVDFNESDTADNSSIDNVNKNKSSNKKILFIFVIVCMAASGFYYLYNTGYLKNDTTAKNQAVFVPNEPVVNNTDSSSSIVISSNTADDNLSIDNNSIADNNSIGQDNMTSASDEVVVQNDELSFPEPIENIPVNKTVTVTFSEECWFKYTTDLGETKEVTANSSTVLTFDIKDWFRMNIGNAIAVNIEFNGETYSNFGKRNHPKYIKYEVKDGKLVVANR